MFALYARENNSGSNSQNLKKALDLLRTHSYGIEGAKKCIAKVLRLFIEAIVIDVLTRVVPDALGRIEFWPVGRKLKYFYITAVSGEPLMGFSFIQPRACKVALKEGCGWREGRLEEAAGNRPNFEQADKVEHMLAEVNSR
jgi:hypothetical protein